MKQKDIFLLAACIVACELAGIIGAVFTSPAITTWYAGLAKPALTPPGWVFGPVWTLLYALMGISFFLIIRRHSGILRDVGGSRTAQRRARGAFAGQLVLNVLWSYLFFGLHSLLGAFIEIVVLWLAIILTMFFFARVSRPAAWLLVPYAVWVAFAGYLNYAIWQLNTGNTQDVFCTLEAKLCPDGSYVGRVGPNCEFRPCPGDGGSGKEGSLPQGYTLDSYTVEKRLETPCSAVSECITPPEYMVQSRCPFTSLCLQNKCAVVCPARRDVGWGEAETLLKECRVGKIARFHSGSVVLYMQDGRKLYAIEPETADVISLAVQMRKTCGDITIMME